MNFLKKSQSLEFPKQIIISNNSFLIEVILSDKKNSSVSLKNNCLIFRLSSKLSKKQTKIHFNELLKKMVLKLEKKPIIKIDLFEDVLEKGKFNFAQEEYLIEYTKNKGVHLKDNVFYVNFHTNIQMIEKYIIKLLCIKYSKRLENYVRNLNQETFNFEIQGFNLKLAQSKWGHCSFDNKLMFNLKLLNAEKDILDYVIIHELAHIKVKNHSMRFWKEVEKFCPNYKKLRKNLKQNPPQLFN